MSATSSFFERVRLRGNPVADPAAVIVRGQARFTVLAARLIRLEWSPTGAFEDRATFAFPNRAASPPPFAVDESSGVLALDTGALRLRYRLDGGPFSAENLSISFDLNGRTIAWTPGTPAGGNLRGTRRTLDGAGGQVALGEGLLSRDGWALHDDSRALVFTAGGEWVEPRPDQDAQDWYFFGYGHDYTSALAEYTTFGGRVPLIPRYVLGAWWSRYWAYSDEDLKALVADFAAHDLPLDVLVIDMDWHTPHSWTGYTWNRELFPDPEAFLRWAHEQGLQVTLNLHPAEGVQEFEEIYPRFATAMGLDPATGEAVPFTPGNREFIRHYFELLHHPMEEQGVDFWWLDWQQGEASDLPGLDPLPWLNHLHFLDSARRGRRPMLYSRWGGLGNHRYYIGFSGDTFSAWPALEFLPYFTATAANVLYGWWSHDIGGHFGNPDPELYVRWLQYGALSPCLRLHSSKDPQSERRPWGFTPEALDASRAAFHLRYQLVPYLYTMARACADTGVSPSRPLYYAYPEAEAAYVCRDAYFLGDQLIAAPIVRPANPATGTGSADVWVPPGTWIDYQTGESFTGPRWARLIGGLERLPMLVREGAILPLAPASRTTAAIPADELILEVFPGQAGAFRLYEDDGATLAYLEGQHEWTPIAVETAPGGACALRIGPAEGRCDELPPERRYEIRFRGTRAPERVLIGGRPAEGWTYDEQALTTVVLVPHTDKRRPLEVTIEREGGIAADAGQHKRAAIIADLRRLLGPAAPQVAWGDLAAAVAALDHPGRADALARLGGPFVHVLEYSALPDAARHLGCVVVAAPRDGGPFDVDLTWTLRSGKGAESEVQSVTGVLEDQILWSPFAFAGPAQPLSWEVEVVVRWQDGSLEHRHRSTVLCPTMPVWRVAVYDPQQVAPAPEEAIDPGSLAAGELAWRTYVSDPAALASLEDPFVVFLGEAHRDALASDAPPAAFALAGIFSPDERDVRIAYNGHGTIACLLNGRPLAEASPDTPLSPRTPARLAAEARVSEPARLRAGANTLMLHLTPAPGTHPWEFSVAAAVLEPDGSPATGLRYGEDGDGAGAP